MSDPKKKKKRSQKEINLENLEAGIRIIRDHTLFGALSYGIQYIKNPFLGKGSYCCVDSKERIYVNEKEYLPPRGWAYAIAHCILHPAFGHFDAEHMPGFDMIQPDGTKIRKVECIPELWNMACDIYVTKFLYDIKFSSPIHADPLAHFPSGLNEEIKIYQYLLENDPVSRKNIYSTASLGKMDMVGLERPVTYDKSKNEYNGFAAAFAYELARSVSKAVSSAGGHTILDPGASSHAMTAAKWFVDHYPLLGGIAAHFKIIEDYRYCQKNEIQIAAIDVSLGELYVNPTMHFSTDEWKFILAHEYLHAGLQHHSRCQGRNPYLWNVACDFVINGWLHDMQIGSMPADGLLYDESLNGLSAETVYDMIVRDMKKYTKLNTFRGYGKGDMIGSSRAKPSDTSSMDLDEFCRSALQQGLTYQEEHNRGFIPAGLIEEIRALSMPSIPWDVELANWFQVYFAPLEKYRTYARPSRRQASTPAIPRPRYQTHDISTDSRTFGVVVDTSGSMSAKQIGMALGSIASYSAAHDVPFARVVFCDAAAYDAGYLSPEDIAGRIQVKGRGGTILQPGISLLENAPDFPKDGPILIITDGQIENKVTITHEHAWLLPKGGYGLPFRSKAPVFRFTE